MSTNSILSQMPLNLGNNLTLRFARLDDVDELAGFNARIHEDEAVGVATRDYMSGRHPTMKASDFTVVEDTQTSRIVSSMNLISQTWAYGGIPFKCGRPELVGTDAKYRRRGLVRKQFEVVHAMSAARGELMLGITGIPWYYRLFGYEMAMDDEGSRSIDGAHLPKLKEGTSETCHLCPITPDDHAFIQEVYGHAIRRHPFAALRSQKEWDYEFNGRSEGNDDRREWSIIVAAEGERLGYVQYFPLLYESKSYIDQIELKPGVGYLGLMSSLLRGLWANAQNMCDTKDKNNREVKAILLLLGRDHPAYKVLPKHLVQTEAPYAWYIRVPDLVAFLRHIRPALEKNLVGTVAERYSGNLKLNFYQSGIKFEFEHGQITESSDWSPESFEDGDAQFPDLTFLQLLCGRRRLDELDASFADCWASDEATVLLDCLFPPFTGEIWQLA